MVNNLIIQGRLTADPEYKNLSTGVTYCSFTIASERAKNKDGERITDFIPCVGFGKTADFISKYFHKGDMAVVSGRMQSRAYEGSDGKKHMVYEAYIMEMNFCGGKSQNKQEDDVAF